MSTRFLKIRRFIGILAAIFSFFFAVWLFLIMFGVVKPTQLFGYPFASSSVLRLVAEFTVGFLMIAALAFL